MIAIQDYMQFISELTAAAARRADVNSYTVRLAITESQLINLLKDQTGIVVCGSIPGARLSDSGNGYWHSRGECLLMVLEKMPKDKQGTTEEAERLARLQRFMANIAHLLANDMETFCDREAVDGSQPMNIEWEYNQYGGFNGLSILFHLADNRGPWM